MDWNAVLWVSFGMAAGGVLKGATGAGAPVLAVPILALLYDVPFAVAIFSVPNLLVNLWQIARGYQGFGAPGFWVSLSVGGAVGAGIGSFALAALNSDILMACVALLVFAYVGFRIVRPTWMMKRAMGERLVWPAGILSGVLQGVGGISAPVSITYLNAMGMPRVEFIPTISALFAGMAVVQIPALFYLDILDWHRFWLSTASAVPQLAAIPLGAWMARYMSSRTFDIALQALLVLISSRMLYQAFT